MAHNRETRGRQAGRLCLLFLGFAPWVWGENTLVLEQLAVSGVPRGMAVRLWHGVEAGHRTLAVLQFSPLGETEWAQLAEQFGVSIFFAPAWLSRKGKLEFWGERFFVHESFMSAFPADFTALELNYGLCTFPRVLVRDEEEEVCPYVMAFPTRFYCLNRDLRATGTFEVPVVAQGYRVVEGEIWVLAARDGFLAHRYERKKKDFVEHALPLSAVRHAVRAAGFSEEEMASLREAAAPEASKAPPAPQAREDSPYEQARLQMYKDFYQPLHTRQRSFQFFLAFSGSRVGVLLRKPLGLVVAQWPEGTKAVFYPVKKEDLPPEVAFGGSQSLFLLGLEGVGKDSFFGLVQTRRPVTLREFRAMDPQGALKHQEEYRRLNQREMGEEEVADLVFFYLGLRFTKGGQLQVTLWKEEELDRKAGVAVDPFRASLFSFKPGQAWLPAILRQNGKSARGMVRLQ